MFLKKTKKKTFTNINKFLLIYFFSTILFAIFLTFAIIQHQIFSESKKYFLDKISKGGRFEYLYLPEILFKASKHIFYPLQKIDMRLKFEDIILLETSRKQAIEAGGLQFLDKIPIVKSEFFFQDKQNYLHSPPFLFLSYKINESLYLYSGFTH